MAFIIVKYGANEEKIVNPNCLSASLLCYIKKSCGYGDLVENVDLASESGEVIDLVSKPREYAKKFVEARGVYILVKVVGDDSEEATAQYVPLLDSAGDKIKFAVTNPTMKVRTKGKTGAKGDPPTKTQEKADPEIQSNPIPNTKNAKQAAPTKKGAGAPDGPKNASTTGNNNSTVTSNNNNNNNNTSTASANSNEKQGISSTSGVQGSSGPNGDEITTEKSGGKGTKTTMPSSQSNTAQSSKKK